MDIGDLDVPIRTRNGTSVYVANIDIEMTLDSASLSFCAVCKGTYKEKRSEQKLVKFV